MARLGRRSTLALICGGMATLAGCAESTTNEENGAGGTDDDDSNDIDVGELPPYADVIADSSDETTFCGAIDVETMFALFDDDPDEETERHEDVHESPLIGNPIAFAILAWTGLYSLGTSPAFEVYLEVDETPDGEGYVTYVDGVYAVTGTFDAQAGPDALEAWGYVPVENDTDERVYEHEETDDVVSVTDEAFVFANNTDGGFDPHGRIERVVETITDERAAKYELDDEFDWLLRAGQNTGITCCWYGNDGTLPESELGSNETEPGETSSVLEFEYAPFAGATAVHQGVTLEDDRAGARSVVTTPNDATFEAETLESDLSAQAETFRITRDESSLLLEAEYGDF